jgi:hypothetical protein
MDAPAVARDSRTTPTTVLPLNVAFMRDLSARTRRNPLKSSVVTLGKTAWPSRCVNWASWDGHSSRSNGCRTLSYDAAATLASTRGSSKTRFGVRCFSTGSVKSNSLILLLRNLSQLGFATATVIVDVREGRHHMGRSRWRNKGQRRSLNRTRQHALTATVAIESATPTCPGMHRDGLDGIVYIELQRLDTLVADMRKGISVPGDWAPDSAVKRYLMYLSMLVDIALSDIAMSAIHGNDIAVQIKQRMLVEYAAKAQYYNAHPDYALYMTTIGEAESVLKKAKTGGYNTATVNLLEEALKETRRDFAHVASVPKPRFDAIMRELTGRDSGRNDEYVWLYGAPSALMHGDPEGMRQMFEADDNGVIQGQIKLRDVQLNALMVDAGSNALTFCNAFISRFDPGNETLNARLADLYRTFKLLVIKHNDGRDTEVLDAIRKELER